MQLLGPAPRVFSAPTSTSRRGSSPSPPCPAPRHAAPTMYLLLAAMGVFTFVCKVEGKEWSAKQHSGDLEASAASTYDLQRKLVQAACSADASGGVQSSFSLITPSSAVFQVIIGGATAAAFVGGAAAAPAGGAPAAEAPAAEEKKKEEKEESEDDDMGFSLFD